MAANPRHTPTPEELPVIGQRARPTIPFVANHDPVAESTEIMVRDPCWRCLGRGHLDGEQTQCIVCSAIWSRENVEAHGQQWIKSTLLPCRHATAHRKPDYVATPCPTCNGSQVGNGYLPRWIRLGELLPWMKDWFEQWYADLSAETTAIQTSQTSQRGRNSF